MTGPTKIGGSEFYPVPADLRAELVPARRLRPRHRGRVVELRFAEPEARRGEGVAGVLEDATAYLTDGTLGIRFVGEQRGYFGDVSTAFVVVHAAGVTVADVLDAEGAEP